MKTIDEIITENLLHKHEGVSGYNHDSVSKMMQKYGEQIAGQIFETDDFKTAATPLIAYMSRKLHPQTAVIVTSTSAQLLEGIKVVKDESFLID